MAPEQIGRMNRSTDSRSDLYSLGILLYEMLTGILPFLASDPMEWVHGPGLDPERFDHLFDPFFSTKPQGLGIGLTVSRSIIEAHNGRLWAKANEPRGAIFQFTLPV